MLAVAEVAHLLHLEQLLLVAQVVEEMGLVVLVVEMGEQILVVEGVEHPIQLQMLLDLVVQE
jgi:hypothetical protein